MATLWRHYSGQTCASAPPAPNSVETSPEKERIREIKENMYANSKRSEPKTRRKMTLQNTRDHPAVIKMKSGKCILFLLVRKHTEHGQLERNQGPFHLKSTPPL